MDLATVYERELGRVRWRLLAYLVALPLGAHYSPMLWDKPAQPWAASVFVATLVLLFGGVSYLTARQLGRRLRRQPNEAVAVQVLESEILKADRRGHWVALAWLAWGVLWIVDGVEHLVAGQRGRGIFGLIAAAAILTSAGQQFVAWYRNRLRLRAGSPPRP
jgi:hypothetical protein